MTAAAILAVAGGVALVRVGWGARFPAAAAVAGWLIALAGLVSLARAAGAWGLAVGTIAGMAAALGALAWSGWRAPRRPRRPERERTAVVAAHEPSALARRAAVFVLVVPVSGGAVLWLGFAGQAAARRWGAGAADASAGLLMLLPLAWCGLMTWQMMRGRPRAMLVPPAMVAAAGALLWLAR